MSQGDDEIKVRFGAETSELNEGASEAEGTVESLTSRIASMFSSMYDSVTGSVEAMNERVREATTESLEQMETVAGGVSKVQKAFALLGEVAIAGFVGEKIFDLAHETAEYAENMEHAAQKTGMGAEALQGLNYAASLMGVGFESVQTGMKKLAQSMDLAQQGSKQQEEAFRRIGIAASDLKGMKIEDVLGRMADKFAESKDGAEKMALAQQLLGRGGLELIPLLNQGSKALEEYTTQAKNMGVIMSEQDIEATAGFEVQLKALHAQMGGVTRKIGEELIPAFSNVLGAMLGGISTSGTFARSLGYIADTIGTVFIGITETVQIAWTALKVILANIVNAFMTVGEVAADVFSGHFAQAVDDAKEGFSVFADSVKDVTKEILDDSKRNSDAIFAMWSGKSMKAPTLEREKPEEEIAPTQKLYAPKEKNRVTEWKGQLDEMKLASDAFLGDQKKSDLAFWEDKLAHVKMSAAEQRDVEHEILTLKQGIRKDDLANDLEAIKLKISQEQAGSEARVQTWNEAVKKIAQAYGTDSKEYKAALQEKEKLAQEHAKLLTQLTDSVTDKNRELANLGIQAEANRIAYLKELGAISGEQEVAMTKKVEDEKAAIEIQALQEKLARYQQGTLEYQKTLNAIELAQAKHNQTIQQLDNKAAAQQAKTFDQVYSSMQSSFSSAITGMLSRTTTFVGALQGIYNSIVKSFIDLGVKMLFDWTKKQILMTAVTQAQETARTSATATGEATRSTVATTGAMTQISANAASAASGAASSQASIPIVGPILAAAAMAAMLAMVLGLSGGMKSAAGGWGQIPGDQIAQVHKDEMILPAELAEGVRQNIGSGSARQQGPASMSVSIHAVDAKSVKRLFAANGSSMASSLRQQARNFTPTKRGNG